MVEEGSITICFYPDEIIIDYQESTNLHINNKYIPRPIKLLEQHLKETKKWTRVLLQPDIFWCPTIIHGLGQQRRVTSESPLRPIKQPPKNF